MKILVIGSGGREHALVWKISQSPRVTKIYCAPGSAGIGELAESVAIGPELGGRRSEGPRRSLAIRAAHQIHLRQGFSSDGGK